MIQPIENTPSINLFERAGRALRPFRVKMHLAQAINQSVIHNNPLVFFPSDVITEFSQRLEITPTQIAQYWNTAVNDLTHRNGSGKIVPFFANKGSQPYMSPVIFSGFSYPVLTTQINISAPSVFYSVVNEGDYLLKIAMPDAYYIFDTLVTLGQKIATNPDGFLSRSAYTLYSGQHIPSFVSEVRISF